MKAWWPSVVSAGPSIKMPTPYRPIYTGVTKMSGELAISLPPTQNLPFNEIYYVLLPLPQLPNPPLGR